VEKGLRGGGGRGEKRGGGKAGEKKSLKLSRKKRKESEGRETSESTLTSQRGLEGGVLGGGWGRTGNCARENLKGGGGLYGSTGKGRSRISPARGY